MIPLSILELGRIREGYDCRNALKGALTLAQHAERLGYKRIWVAEHHNSTGVSTAATSVVIAHIAGGTSTIRVGAGGIMLPNHAPYVIAEQFGTLEALFPGRIDLGLGRAPGTDQMTLRALRRAPNNADNFPQDIEELQVFLGPKEANQTIEAVPGTDSNVPLWILGSSLYGAQLAASLGLPYGFASHFAPQALYQAVNIYRTHFQSSTQLAKPHTLVGVNVIAAESDEEAQYLATSQQMSFTDLFRGTRGKMQAPIDNIDDYWTPQERIQVERMLNCSVIGSAETVRQGLTQLIQDTGADELMIVSDIFDQDKRYRSLEITQQAMA